MIADLLIVGGTIVDGIVCPGYQADRAVRDGKIADVAMIASCAHTPTLDAPDLVGDSSKLAVVTGAGTGTAQKATTIGLANEGAMVIAFGRGWDR